MASATDVTYSVRGTVTNVQNRNLPDLLVRAYDRDLRSEELLGENITDRNGKYEIRYTPAAFKRSEKLSADLVVKVFGRNGKQVLYEPDMDHILFNAPPDAIVNITITAEIKATDNEFEFILRELQPLLENVPLTELQENITVRDISFLNKETNLPSDKLEHIVVAHRLQGISKIDAAFFYGLLRKNTLLQLDITRPLHTLASIDIHSETKPLLYAAALVDEKKIQSDIKKAISEMIIPSRVGKELREILAQLNALREEALKYENQEKKRKLLNLISNFLWKDKLGEMTLLFEANKNDYSKFLDAVAAGDFFQSANDERQGRIAFALGEVLGFDEDIITNVKDTQKIKKPQDVKKLAKLNRKEWKKVLTDSAKDIVTGGRNLDKKLIDFHASTLVRKMESKYPSVAFAAQLEREKDKKFTQHDQMVNLFDKNEDFDLQHSNIEAFFKAKKLSTKKNESLKNELKSVQRVFKLIPNYRKTNALLSSKIHSAQSIVGTGESRFVNDIAPAAGISKKEAKKIFQKAANVHTASLLIVGELQDTFRAMDIAALKVMSLSAKLEAVSKDFPNLKSLFQLTDLCACEHCRSVYSPAAYLVELLQFLDKRTVVDLSTIPPTPGHLAKDVLFERRPDIGEIDLGCENAETPLPYIDLVCELLEEEIEPDPGIVYNGPLANGKIPNALQTLLVANNIQVTDKALVYEPLDALINPAFYLRDVKVVCKISPTGPNQWLVKLLHQTQSTSAELAAAPEYVNLNAYNTLSTESFAFKLPFNLPHTEASAYFKRFDISRADLMQDFQIAGVPPDEAIAAEKLGLTDAERELIVTPDATNQELYWNTMAPNVVDYMKVVDHFLVKSGLSYPALNNLLALQFIDAADSLFIRHLDFTCDTEQKEIAGLDEPALDRMHRFLRLVKLTGWKQEIVDEIIMQANLGNGTLDDNCLVVMSKLSALTEATGIRLEELIGFYGTIPHAILPDAVVKPLYQSVFQNKATTGFLDETLLPEKVDGSTTLASHQVSLAACLQVSEQDFNKLIATFVNTDLNFENLSHLFAITRLCRKLKLSIDDYIILTELTGLDVFSDPSVTLDFVEHVQIARSSPLKTADINFILSHEALNLAEREISEDRVKSILESLQSAYQQAFEENRSPFDDGLSADELREPLKLLLSRLPGFSEEITNNFLKMADKLWVTPPDPVAPIYIDDQLTASFDAPTRTSIKNLQAALDAAPPNSVEAARKAFIESLLSALSAYFYKVDKAVILTTALATSFKADEETVTALLEEAILRQPAPGTALINELLSSDSLIDIVNQPPASPPITPVAFPQQFDALKLLHKLFGFIKLLQLDDTSITRFLQNNEGLGWMELDGIPYKAGQTNIPYSEWESFVKVLILLKKLTPVPDPKDAENPLTFYSVMELLLPAATTTLPEWLDAFALLTGYNRTMAEDVDLFFGFSNPNLDTYREPVTWLHFDKSINYLRRLGVDVTMVQSFIKPVLLANDTSNLRMALKARYDEFLWLDTLKEIMDSIRPKKRNALVAYLLAVNPDLVDENDLFDFYLVDTQMEACMPSSRIVQAHGSIQLFVQRCLLGLEPTAAADVNNDSGWKQWEWMKNYRVWEANRKVFLYPENWIEPELLNDKSYLFVEMEDQLLQDDVNEFTAEDAMIRYLEKLDEIAFLEVVAQYYQADIYTMHVFARTKGGDPATYYYRRFEQERYWTPWEIVDLDITSDQLLAFVHNNRLCLAWPIFSEVPNPTHQVTIPGVSANDGQPKDQKKVERKLKIQMAISAFANKKWKPKKVSNEGILTPDSYTIDDLPHDPYNLMYFEFSEQIPVFHSAIPENNQEYYYLDGIFNITGCKGYPELVSTKPGYFPDFFPDFKDSWLTHQRYLELGYDVPNDLAERNALFLFNFFEILEETPGKFRLTYPHQFTWIDLLALLYEILIMKALAGVSDYRGNRFKIPLGTLLPYFFEDSEHNYVIVPGFYREDRDEETGKSLLVRRTFTDVLQLLEDIVALYNKYAKKIKDDPNIDPNVLLQELIADPDFQHILSELQVYQTLKYGEQFRNMYHPLLCMLRKTLYKDGVAALMKRETQLTVTPFDFNKYYKPNPAIVPQPYPIEDLDFSSEGSYSGYNWELFFHAPLMLATRLTQNQQFEDSLTWFHYMFNPTGALDGTVPQKYWVTKPFYLTLTADYIAQRIDTLLHKIADPSTPEIKELEFAIDQWRTKPFMPHVVARFRPVAYQKALLMKYLNNLIEWGDNLFRQDTMESVTQATQMYILADKLLGPKPRIIPPVVKVPYETYNQLEAKLDAFGNALIEFENLLPDITVLPHEGEELPPPPITISSLYFCIPQNDKMLEYWDLIADRVFKIRHCQNIDGVERTLALFAPPIDPGMLVRAAAAGLDISAILAGLNAPLPNYRFNIMSQKATELVQEVRGLGNALLQALEKKDAESLALLRNELEIKMLKAILDMKKIQVKEAEEQIEVLQRTKAVTAERDNYFAAIEKIIPGEQLNLDKLSTAHDFQMAAQIVQAAGAVLGLIPDFSLGAHGFGGSPAVDVTFGGTFLAGAANAATSILNILAGAACYEANRASILAGFERRFSDWKLQERLAKLEIKQIDQQIGAAEIRLEISEADVKNQELQIENAEKTDEFMRSKFTNKELYQWMIGQISSVYFKAYKLAYDVGKKTERCYQHELGSTDTFLKFGYWDSLKKGLQTADQLFYDLKKMETSYLDKNKREYEVTKHISLSLLDPLALVRLRATGISDFQVPEALFDMDHPGHYFRRTKTVSITLPCIAGPYTGVSCKLSLVNNKYRKNTAKAQVPPDYDEVPGNDERFIYNVGSIQSVATSNAQNDSGLFELNFRDERYLPFEGTGAISTWRLELPNEVRLFDYNSISDVIIHMKYTAREGGSTLRTLAAATLKDKLNEINQQLNKTGLHLPIQMKHDMPNEWFLLKKDGTITLQVGKTRLPYFAQALNCEIDRITFIAKVKNNPDSFTITIDAANLLLNRKDEWKLCLKDTTAIELDTPFTISVAQLQLDNLEELMLMVKYVFV